jgi:hypothetical protein
MKNKTALKQSISSVKFLLLVVTVMLFLAVRYPSRYTVVPLIISAAFLILELITLRHIRRKASEDPTYLDQRLK